MILSKSMEELKAAMDAGIVDSMWGTAVNVFAIVHNRDLVDHRLEMWKVTP